MVRKLETLAADAETLKAYLRQIAGMPRLTVEEERDLARRVRQHGDEQALSRLVESNLRVVVSYARRFRPLGVPALTLGDSRRLSPDDPVIVSTARLAVLGR